MADDADKPQESPDLNFHTDMPVGEILRRTRVHYGQTLDQIEVILRIRASQLEALEQGDISKLPGRVYAIGFVRSYSEYLGLDGDKMVHLFKEQSVGRQKKPDLSFPVPASESKVPNLAIIGGSLFGFLVLVGFVAFLMFPKSEKNNIPDVPDALTKTQLNEAPSLVAGTPANSATPDTKSVAGAEGEAATPPANTNRIIIEVKDSSWVEIRNAEGAAILRQVLKPGDIYLVPNEDGLIMATGNAGGLRIKVDGKEIKPLGEAGQIKRKIVLNPAALTAKKP
jgi:cytoskeleton protein RodZ